MFAKAEIDSFRLTYEGAWKIMEILNNEYEPRYFCLPSDDPLLSAMTEYKSNVEKTMALAHELVSENCLNYCKQSLAEFEQKLKECRAFQKQFPVNSDLYEGTRLHDCIHAFERCFVSVLKLTSDYQNIREAKYLPGPKSHKSDPSPRIGNRHVNEKQNLYNTRGYGGPKPR